MFELAPLYLLGAVGLYLAVAGKKTAPGVGIGAQGNRVASLLRDPGIIAAWAAAVAVLFGFVSFYSGTQVFGANIGVDLQTVRLIGLPPLLLTFAAAPMTRRYGAPVTARIGLALAALANGVGAIASSTAIMVASGALSAGVAFAVPGLIATVAGRATNGNRGLALAIYSFALFLGASFAPPVAQTLPGSGSFRSCWFRLRCCLRPLPGSPSASAGLSPPTQAKETPTCLAYALPSCLPHSALSPAPPPTSRSQTLRKEQP
jgi:hypothetical protein